MNITAPTPTPTEKAISLRASLIPLAWRLPKGIKSASDDELELSGDVCETWGWVCGGIVALGVVAEVAIAYFHPPYGSFWEQWGSVVSNAFVVLGFAGEIQFSRMAFRRDKELKRRSDEKLGAAVKDAAAANERASSADLARIPLEARLLPREINKSQFDIIQGLRGSFRKLVLPLKQMWKRNGLRDKLGMRFFLLESELRCIRDLRTSTASQR